MNLPTPAQVAGAGSLPSLSLGGGGAIQFVLLASAGPLGNDLPLVPVVSLRATRAETREPLCDPALCDAAVPAPGVFLLSRSGADLTSALSVLIQYTGTASNGTDYDSLPAFTTIPAGQESVEVLVSPRFDALVEGDETVLAALQPDPSMGPIERYRVDPTQGTATVVIHDREAPAELPVVRVDATQPIAEETSHPFRRLALRGEFTVSRTGPTNELLSVFVRYSGMATPGADYPPLPFRVTIPAGATSTAIEVVPVDDRIAEGLETLVAVLSDCPPDTKPPLGMPCVGGLTIDPAHEQATVFLRDDGVTEASVVITNPPDGATFKAGDRILLEGVALDLHGYLSRVTFWDTAVEQQIGVSEIWFIRAPEDGTPIHHRFVWTNAAPGRHVLVARVLASDGRSVLLSSPPVRITVEPAANQPPQVAITQPLAGTDFPSGVPVEIVAAVRDPDGYVGRVEFLADERSIGEVVLNFIRRPDPGLPQTFSFTWNQTTPGSHSLTVRATDDAGTVVTSAPVAITIASTEPLPTVTVITSDALATEPRSAAELDTAGFRLCRFGPTNDALVVAYSLHGTAVNGTDYELLPGLATIPAGERSGTVLVRPLADSLAEGLETVILKVEEPPPPSPEIRVINPYRVGRPSRAVALISDGPWSLPPRQAQCSTLPGNLLHLSFAAEAGRTFHLEASSDLRNWEALSDDVSSDGAWHFIDADMDDHPHRFYRLVPDPAAPVSPPSGQSP